MTLRRRDAALAIAALGLCACATVKPLPPGPVREIIPRVGDREVMLTDRSGRFVRLTAVRLVGDSVIGLSIEDAHRVALAADDVQQVRVFGNDPITSVASSYGVFLILIGAAAVLGIATHLAAR